MNVTGAVDAFVAACARLLPRGERPSPSTLIAGSTLFSASYERASDWRYCAAATRAPEASNCGRQNRG